jgi:hypothetical protein
MTALDCLRKHGRMTASEIADYTGADLVDVYCELVPAEARGEASFDVVRWADNTQTREWFIIGSNH